jgi:hypothetical protein
MKKAEKRELEEILGEIAVPKEINVELEEKFKDFKERVQSKKKF